MPDPTEIQNLLKLKRYEQPPQEYYNQFLREFQHRQRAELIRKPLWKIVSHRVQDFLSEPLITQWAYATATVVVLGVAGVTSMKILNSGSDEIQSPITIAVHSIPRNDKQPQSRMGLIEPQIRLADWSTIPSPSVSARAQSAVTSPHYVIDTRPVSYEPPSSF